MWVQAKNGWGGLERQCRGKIFPMGRVSSNAPGHPVCKENVATGENIYNSWAVVNDLALWSEAWKENHWKIRTHRYGVEARGQTYGVGMNCELIHC